MKSMNLKAEISDDAPLTKGQKRIFALAVLGAKQKQIKERLHREISTIQTHIRMILASMECDNITEAAAKATAEGWLKITKRLDARKNSIGWQKSKGFFTWLIRKLG